MQPRLLCSPLYPCNQRGCTLPCTPEHLGYRLGRASEGCAWLCTAPILPRHCPAANLLCMQEHAAAEAQQPKQVWARPDMLRVDSQHTSGASTERLDDQHVQTAISDLAAVPDAIALPAEAPAAQPSVHAHRHEHAKVKCKHLALRHCFMLRQDPCSSSLCCIPLVIAIPGEICKKPGSVSVVLHAGGLKAVLLQLRRALRCKPEDKCSWWRVQG